jgi:hypothetical protein
MTMKHDSPPEWIDAREVKRIFSLGKTTLYHFAAAGKIRTTSLREIGKLRGKRLFSYQSISSLLESRASGGEDAGPDAGNQLSHSTRP